MFFMLPQKCTCPGRFSTKKWRGIIHAIPDPRLSAIGDLLPDVGVRLRSKHIPGFSEGLHPITGALWHNCGSVFVVVNAALLLRLKDTDTAN